MLCVDADEVIGRVVEYLALELCVDTDVVGVVVVYIVEVV